MTWPVTCCCCNHKWFTARKTYFVVCPKCMETVPNNPDAAAHRKLVSPAVRKCEIGLG